LGHEENLGVGDVVATDISEVFSPIVIIGKVVDVTDTGRVKINIGDGVTFTAVIEAVQWLMRASGTIFNGGARSKWKKE